MPRQIGPEGHLGLLYMHVGREDDARRTLRAAFRGDPFNVRVKNSLEVLDVLEGMQTLDRARFTVRYQGGRGRAAGPLRRAAPGKGLSAPVPAVRLRPAGEDAGGDFQPGPRAGRPPVVQRG